MAIKSSFLTLPRKIRDEIYHYALYSGLPVIITSQPITFNESVVMACKDLLELQHSSLPLLSLNFNPKFSIAHEAAVVCFGINTFWVDYDLLNAFLQYGKLGHTGIEWSFRPLYYITDLHIIIHPKDLASISGFEKTIKLLTLCPQLTQLLLTLMEKPSSEWCKSLRALKNLAGCLLKSEKMTGICQTRVDLKMVDCSTGEEGMEIQQYFGLQELKGSAEAMIKIFRGRCDEQGGCKVHGDVQL